MNRGWIAGSSMIAVALSSRNPGTSIGRSSSISIPPLPLYRL